MDHDSSLTGIRIIRWFDQGQFPGWTFWVNPDEAQTRLYNQLRLGASQNVDVTVSPAIPPTQWKLLRIIVKAQYSDEMQI